MQSGWRWNGLIHRLGSLWFESVEVPFLSKKAVEQVVSPRNLFVEVIEGLWKGKTDELEEMVG
jgi:hypothetical protein